MPVSRTFLPIVSVMLASFGTCVPVPMFSADPNDSVALPPNIASAPEPLYVPSTTDVALNPVLKLEFVYKKNSVVPLPLVTSI